MRTEDPFVILADIWASLEDWKDRQAQGHYHKASNRLQDARVMLSYLQEWMDQAEEAPCDSPT